MGRDAGTWHRGASRIPVQARSAARMTFAMPCSPAAFGCRGAAELPGISGSVHRVLLPLQASRPMEGVYTSMYSAPLAAAVLASMALSDRWIPRRYDTSPYAIGTTGQQPRPESGRSVT